MPWQTVGKESSTLMTLAALGLAAVLGYEFYAPIVGQIATGDEAEARPAIPRDRASIKVEAYMAGELGRRLPTLADVIRYYGLEEDTVPCTVQENYGEAASPVAIPVLVKRPIKIGDEVTLCLD